MSAGHTHNVGYQVVYIPGGQGQVVGPVTVVDSTAVANSHVLHAYA